MHNITIYIVLIVAVAIIALYCFLEWYFIGRDLRLLRLCKQDFRNNEVEVEANRDSDGNTYYTLKYNGAISSLPLYMEPTKEFLNCFKSGVLAERERIWNESEDLH